MITTAPGAGWAVANWLVTNASSYGITQVSYAGYQWTARLTETSWQSDSGRDSGGYCRQLARRTTILCGS